MAGGFFGQRDMSQRLRNGGRLTWRGRAMMRAYGRATKESVTLTLKDLKKVIKGDTPRSRPGKHRVRRKYPSGQVRHEPKRLHTTIYSRVKDRGDRGILGFVSFRYGYINLLIGWMKKQGLPNFMEEARDRNAGLLMRRLRGKAAPISREYSKRPVRWTTGPGGGG